jgi:ribosome-interacting GTPase 1
VVDLSDPDCVGEMQVLHDILREKRVTPTARWGPGQGAGPPGENADDPFALELPALLLANKADRMADVATELAAFMELSGLSYPVLAVSATSGYGLGELGSWLFRNLGVVRVYTKTPGHPPDRDRPFTLRRGQTVEDVARLVHRDLARTLRYARVWGKSGFDGQQIGREHVMGDGDVVELHS